MPTKLAITAETDADKYDYHTVPRCLACDPSGPGKDLPVTDKLDEVIRGVMTAMSSAQQSEVKAWEEEIVPCQHTRELVQPGEPVKLEPSGLASCGKCDLTSNLWLCLTCGHLGCGRAQFGGVGGNSHGLSHFEESGHPVSVKQGTITAEGSADIYCYACNDARIDPNLAQHLSHFGINVMDLSKTEKSMTELQIEQNLKFDFNMTGEDGKMLEPIFGPGLTGLRNLGNSCYLASVLQSLFSLPAFQKRYGDAYRPHTLACTNQPLRASIVKSPRSPTVYCPVATRIHASQNRTLIRLGRQQTAETTNSSSHSSRRASDPACSKRWSGRDTRSSRPCDSKMRTSFFKYLVALCRRRTAILRRRPHLRPLKILPPSLASG